MRQAARRNLSVVKSDRKPIVPWGEANPRRGLENCELAIKFGKQFPIGSQPSGTEIDHYAQQHGYYVVPAGGKNSNEWSTHIQHRYKFLAKVRRGAAHPRLRMMNSTPYVIDFIAPDLWEVREPEKAAFCAHVVERAVHFTKNQRRKQVHIMQAMADETVYEKRLIYKRILEDIDECIEENERRIAKAFKRAANEALELGFHDLVRQLTKQ